MVKIKNNSAKKAQRASITKSEIVTQLAQDGKTIHKIAKPYTR